MKKNKLTTNNDLDDKLKQEVIARQIEDHLIRISKRTNISAADQNERKELAAREANNILNAINHGLSLIHRTSKDKKMANFYGLCGGGTTFALISLFTLITEEESISVFVVNALVSALMGGITKYGVIKGQKAIIKRMKKELEDKSLEHFGNIIKPKS